MMGKIDELTKYIDIIEIDNIGEWVFDKENDGTPSHPIQIPYVNYSDEVINFISDFYKFAESNPEMGLNNYQEILKKKGLSLDIEAMIATDVSELEQEDVLALIMGTVRADRFAEGSLLKVFQSCSMMRWLERLKKLD